MRAAGDACGARSPWERGSEEIPYDHQPIEAVAEATAWKDFSYASIRARDQTFFALVASAVMRVCSGEAEP